MMYVFFFFYVFDFNAILLMRRKAVRLVFINLIQSMLIKPSIAKSLDMAPLLL